MGTTAIGAVLSNPLTGRFHPVCWWVKPGGEEGCWSLPAIAHLPPEFAQNQAEVRIQLPVPGVPAAEGVLLCDLKAAFEIGLPYVPAPEENAPTNLPIDPGWQPLLNWYFQPAQPQRTLAEQAPISLHLVLRALGQLLATLRPVVNRRASSLPLQSWHCGADGLSDAEFSQILGNLEGVIVSCPADCNEAYRFNLREAVVEAQLVQRAEQVAFLEEPIATLLAEFCPGQGQAVFNAPDWQGATLVVHAGAASTELAVVCLPNGLHNLTHADFKLRSFGYGEQAFKQDIACQLLTPFIPQDQLGLDLAVLPIPGEPDPTVRSQLQRQLYRSPAGKMLLDASAYLQKALKHQERITFEFGPYACTFSQAAMDTKVTQPFVMRLNREISRLLGEAGVKRDGIAQVLCTGNPATLPMIQAWLQKQLPQARWVGPVAQANSTETEAAAEFVNHRVAYGLASLPVYAQVLDRPQQQYSDYFLLMELLRSLPPEALTTAEILGYLEGRGINTQACQGRIVAILEGEVPSGLLPEPSDVWAMASRANAHYQALQIKPLFTRPSPQSYQLDREQRQRFLDYWKQITRHSHQTLAEPCILEFGIAV